MASGLSVQSTRIAELYTLEYVPEGKALGQVLFIHGFPGSQKNYELAESVVSRGYKVLVPHQVGLGLSEGEFSFLASYKKLDAYCQEVNRLFGPIDICVGHSWGGYLAVLLQAHFKKAICLLGPLCKIPSLDADSYEAFAKIVHAFAPSVFKSASFSEIASDLEALSGLHSNQLEALKNTSQKLLLLHGSKDSSVPLKDAQEMKNCLAERLELMVLEDDDHWLTYSRAYLYGKFLDILLAE